MKNKKIKAEKLFQDFNISYIAEKDGHKRSTEGWINVHCPFCEGKRDFHLGYNLKEGFFNCWRCGWHPLTATLSALLKISEQEAEEVTKRYQGQARISQKAKLVKTAKILTLPSGIGPLEERHRKYLKRRGFIPEELESLWDLKGTGPCSVLKSGEGKLINYSHRILAPIYWGGKIVTYQARDITGKHKHKYLACPEVKEVIKHKNILYKAPFIQQRDRILCVEGIVDAWRFKGYAVATLGIKFTSFQVAELAKYKEVIVIFDQEPQARSQADKLIGELNFRKVKAHRIDLEKGDPGELSQEEANKIIKEVIQND